VGHKKKAAGEDPRNVFSQRNGLLAKVHIAKKELGMDDLVYRNILVQGFGVTTSAALSRPQLEELVKHFESCGWVPRKKRETKKSYVVSLRERAYAMARDLGLAAKRMRGLCRLTCKVDDPAWCTDPEKLQRLLAVLGKLKREGEDGRGNP
jgi:hypothetical protein